MRSKFSWWMSVAFLSVFYGFVGLTAAFAQAFETLFGLRDSFSVLQASGGLIMAAAMSALALTWLVSIVSAVVWRGRVWIVCADLIRLHAFALWGAAIPYACGSHHPRIAAPAAIGVGALLLAVDRKEIARERPWQTWALASLAGLIALPILLISRL